MKYLYTAGVAGSRFYEDLSKGRLSGTYCHHCQVTHLPATAFCEIGMVALDPTRDAREIDPQAGIVVSHTTVHEDRAGHPLARPQVVVQVAFPETVGTLIGRLEIDDPARVTEGLGVELVAAASTGPQHVLFRAAAR